MLETKVTQLFGIKHPIVQGERSGFCETSIVRV